LPTWHRAVPPPDRPPPTDGPWLIFADTGGVADEVAERLKAARIVRVSADDGFAATGEDTFTLCPTKSEDYAKLLDVVRPRYVLHLWSLDEPPVSTDAEAGEWLM